MENRYICRVIMVIRVAKGFLGFLNCAGLHSSHDLEVYTQPYIGKSAVIISRIASQKPSTHGRAIDIYKRLLCLKIWRSSALMHPCPCLRMVQAGLRQDEIPFYEARERNAWALISKMVEQKAPPDARTVDSYVVFYVSHVQKLLLFVGAPKKSRLLYHTDQEDCCVKSLVSQFCSMNFSKQNSIEFSLAG